MIAGLAAWTRPPTVGSSEVIAASDVEYHCWDHGARPGCSPQRRGRSPTVAVLEGRLAAWAIELDAAAGRRVACRAGRGRRQYRGWAARGWRPVRQSGAAIAEHTHFADDADAELIIWWEFDEQSLHP